MADVKEMTLEETFEAVETVLREMETGDLSLEETFEKYEQGVKLVKACSEKIDRVEKKLQLLQADGTLTEA